MGRGASNSNVHQPRTEQRIQAQLLPPRHLQPPEDWQRQHPGIQVGEHAADGIRYEEPVPQGLVPHHGHDDRLATARNADADEGDDVGGVEERDAGDAAVDETAHQPAAGREKKANVQHEQRQLDEERAGRVETVGGNASLRVWGRAERGRLDQCCAISLAPRGNEMNCRKKSRGERWTELELRRKGNREKWQPTATN